ncbi:MAG: hypothetical protein US97_C0007G0008 [Microgenomates group bacterium GW2011_GWF1_38_5]|nr:MAG: hypothetical protein US97_C0007G0008 [Microgenomates group bacterium GW2011_GWF1_38_5]
MDDDFSRFDDSVVEVDEVEGTDIKINPDYYLHRCLEGCRDALLKDDVKAGFIQYRLLVEQMEIIVKAAHLLDDGYDLEIKDFIDKSDEKDVLIKGVHIAQKKLGLILKSVFSSKVTTTPMRL